MWRAGPVWVWEENIALYFLFSVLAPELSLSLSAGSPACWPGWLGMPGQPGTASQQSAVLSLTAGSETHREHWHTLALGLGEM